MSKMRRASARRKTELTRILGHKPDWSERMSHWLKECEIKAAFKRRRPKSLPQSMPPGEPDPATNTDIHSVDYAEDPIY